MCNMAKYEGINENLMRFMSRHLGRLVEEFKWDKQPGMTKVKNNYCIPKEILSF